MEGALLINKPPGPTSHDVVYRVRRATGIRRVGHAGTLDPLAAGLLVACIGRATRLIEYLMGHAKVYEAVVRLGASTNTYDLEGELSNERPVPALGEEDIEAVLNRFRGPIEQVPPLYSAIKKDGQPLYKLARAGKTVDLPPRPVTIYALECLGWARPDLTVRVHCSTGTYIRSLAHDIGEAVGCGAHLAALRRTAVGPFLIEQALELEALTAERAQKHLLSPGEAIPHIQPFVGTGDEIKALLNGRTVEAPADIPTGERRQLQDVAGRFYGVIRRGKEGWRPEKMFPL